MDLKALAMKVLDSKPTIKPELKNVENRGKLLPLKNSQKFTPISEEWITENFDLLTAQGFTKKDLFNQKLPVGIAQLSLWKKKDLTVKLKSNTLFFTWTNQAGKQVTQTARPEKTAANKRGKKWLNSETTF